jgi:uncharacterized protein (TIGR02597 family)
MHRAIFAAGLSVLLGLVLSSYGDVASRIVGYNVVDCPAGSDTIVSVPFCRPASFSGAVSGTPAASGSAVTITPAGNPVFAAGEFTTEAHYLRFLGQGGRSGWIFEVTSNNAGTVTIDAAGEDLADVVQGDRFEVVPHWTLATLFPPATQATIHESANKLSIGRKTRVLFFDVTTEGIDLAPDRIYFLTADGWFHSAAGLEEADGVTVKPGQPFVIRHPATESATKFIPHQVVVQADHGAPLRTRAAGSQDNVVGLVRPVPVKLSELDLGAVFTESASNDSGNRADELLVYDNVAAAVNKQPSATYFRVSGEWREDDGGTFPNADNTTVLPSTGLVVRKAATTGGETLRWLNTPRY